MRQMKLKIERFFNQRFEEKNRIRKERLLREEKEQLAREKAWLIKQVKGFTYGGVSFGPPGGTTWEEAATLATLPKNKKGQFKTELQRQWEEEAFKYFSQNNNDSNIEPE